MSIYVSAHVTDNNKIHTDHLEYPNKTIEILHQQSAAVVVVVYVSLHSFLFRSSNLNIYNSIKYNFKVIDAVTGCYAEECLRLYFENDYNVLYSS